MSQEIVKITLNIVQLSKYSNCYEIPTTQVMTVAMSYIEYHRQKGVSANLTENRNALFLCRLIRPQASLCAIER
ncbi:hypothetical protein BDA96_09G222000 [Sorghum bicolor]|jgi:hypothetical protein|uniref:Uncharacterized protein n=2 Tax=Sorghum bicolor TaxID=4558 RepID=A0A921U4Y5_SORBI|nr:hypothetical protein BDA96_09G222000 [Sorghum bicolor]OQU78348.1 hypothetical protein SORBI_3009G210250 [Sorghum bicolor]